MFMQKYHASTNCIPKTIQRTIKYLNDPFKNIINLSKTKNKKKKKTFTYNEFKY